MKNKEERKIRFAGWTRQPYRNIRKRLRRIVSKEIGYVLKGAR